MHVLKKALEKIIHNSKLCGQNIDITEVDIENARLAALLHDVGHYPYSHALDKLIPDDHESYSVSLIQNHFAQYIDGRNTTAKDVVKLIEGKGTLKKRFLNSLISSQLDVDKFDYLLRDSHYAGVKYGIFDLDRLIDSLLVIDDDLVVSDKGYYAAEQLIVARYYMFEQVYYHRPKRAFEGMARNAAALMTEDRELGYPSLQELQNSQQLKMFPQTNDSWFLNRLIHSSNHETNKIAIQIQKRIPYTVIVDSDTIKNKGGKREDPKTSSGLVGGIESDLRANLERLGMHQSSIIFDEFQSIPYRLRPYTRLPEGKDEPDTVLIYNQKIGSVEPIEERSLIINALATNIINKRRIYALESEKHKVSDILSKYSDSLG